VFGRRGDIELHRLISRQNEELREFVREITLRNEKVWQAVTAELREMKNELHDMRGQTQANTKAVLAVLDRLEGSDGTAQA
jgi:predicted transcriptional regulator